MELKGAIKNESRRLKLIVYNLTKGKLKVLKVLLKALGMNFKEEVSSSSIEEEYPYTDEFKERIRKGREDYKAGRTKTVRAKDIWNDEAWV